MAARAASSRVALIEREIKQWLRAFVGEVAIHDWMLLAYVATLVGAAAGASPHPLRAYCIAATLALALTIAATVFLVRGGFARSEPWAALLYRVGLVVPFVASYFLLRDLLPVVSPGTVDPKLYALDVAIFGGEPAFWLERVVTPARAEWLAFWYLAYYALVAAYTLPLLFASARTRLVTEFCVGILLVFCTAHLSYVLVPAWGPYVAYADRFAAPLPRGPRVTAMLATVAAGGSQKDIFPSLHTAGPVFLALFAFRHRDEAPFRTVWHLTVFAALTIVAAAMILRWHYAIDVVAGLLLAWIASVVSGPVAAWECKRRARGMHGAAWPPPVARFAPTIR